MIHVVAMKCLIGLPFYEGVGAGVLKIQESESEVLKVEESEPESEVLCTDSTALVQYSAKLQYVTADV
jgi:hypothetical protein